MAYTTKNKLKRTMREVLDDEAWHERRGTMNNAVKIKRVRQFRSTQKISKRQKEAQVARIQEESEEQRLANQPRSKRGRTTRRPIPGAAGT